LVEHVLGKDEVTGSIPVMGSMHGLKTEFKQVKTTQEKPTKVTSGDPFNG
jgi:hypothetical protein